jgi:transcriptional regulator with XRE-family HTH domain
MSDSKPNETLAGRIRRRMTVRGFNQTTFATKLGMERTELNRSLNEKRQFRAEELSWIAQALETSVDELADGLELPSALLKTRDELQELARRVLDAEADRERARVELKTVEDGFAAERTRWEKERSELVATASTLQSAHAGENARARDAEARAQALGSALKAEQETSAKLKRDAATANQLATRNYVAAKTLESQLRETQEKLAKEQSAKVATGLLAGLAGMWVGGTFGGGGGGGTESDGDDLD